jgi:glucose-6-phosphate 1-dehydrogenase
MKKVTNLITKLAASTKATPPDAIHDPCIMVIFGATGDLTKRKLIPALYNLAKSKLLPPNFAIIGFAYDDLTTEVFREQLSENIKEFATGSVKMEVWNWFLERTYYVQGDFQNPAAYEKLKEQLLEVGDKHKIPGNYCYYLATAPTFFLEIVRQLGVVGLAKEEKHFWRRAIIEKPFGHDVESARALNIELNKTLENRQIYRIDHYLGKETVQNILVFRFANSIFEPIWDRRYIDHVQITAAESVGVEQRGNFYEANGALRDMVPNHLFQLLSLITMEPPSSFDANAVRDEQNKVIQSVKIPSYEDVLTKMVRGQYGRNLLGGDPCVDYRSEPYVSPKSDTETFVALKLMIDSWRWADVPFYLRSGKRMNQQVTTISIHFRRTPLALFRDTPSEHLENNRLVIQIQPNAGISLQIGHKVPGQSMKLGVVEMDFETVDYFGSVTNTGYERLLHDAMTGDATLFQRADMVESGWGIIQPILDVWGTLKPKDFPNYAAGTWGPRGANELLAHDGRNWLDFSAIQTYSQNAVQASSQINLEAHQANRFR